MADVRRQIDELLNPSQVESLLGRLPTGKLEVLVYDSSNSPRNIELPDILPFMTLTDIKLAIYVAMGMKDIALPPFTFVGRKRELENQFLPLEFSWSNSTTPTELLTLHNPIETMTAPDVDTRFVEASGERRILGINSLERMTIEDVFLKKSEAKPPVFHVYFYENLAASIPGERPIGQREWNGRLFPYFPQLSAEHTQPSEDERKIAQKHVKGFLRRRDFFGKLEKILNDGEPLVPLTLTGVRFIRMAYMKSSVPIPGVETLFYQTPVTPRRPYMRLLSATGSAISKIQMIGDKPNLEDPRLLPQWAQERNPTPDRDFALAKILLRKASGNITPLYFTLRLLDDGSADITIEPPRGVKKLDPQSELDELAVALEEGVRGLPYSSSSLHLSNGMFVFGLKFKGSEPFTTSSLREKLPVFSAVLQEIPPLLGERPLLMLRYKLVSNFMTEDNVQTFITQVMNRNLIHGGDLGNLVDLVANEFDMTLEQAKKSVTDKLHSAGEVTVVNSDEYALYKNPGVDIAIFGQHPLYSFHMYRVDGKETLERCITFISMLFSVSTQRLAVPVNAVKEILESESKEEEEEDEFENVDETDFMNPPTVEQAAEVAGTTEMPDYYDDFMFDIGEGPTLEEEHVASRAEGPVIAEQVRNEPPEEEAKVAEDIGVKTVETEQGFETYFSNKLKEADRRLFDFHKTHASLKKYVSQCQSNLMRQPAVLTEAKYQKMLEEYSDLLESDPPQIVFYVFPLEKNETYKPATEYYTLMRYGSSEKNQNYYLCCKFFCTRDEIMVRETEFLGTVLRRPVKMADGTLRKRKNPKTCPFCEGGLIINRRFPGLNQTVLERNVKPGTSDGRHTFIQFLKKTNHPDGLYLPCCFLGDQPIRMGHPAFPERVSAFPEQVEEDEDAPATDATDVKLVSYEDVLYKANQAYIVGSEKFPLEGSVKKISKKGAAPKMSMPQIGLLSDALNKYFSQNSVDLVSRTLNPQKLKGDAQGFFRVGVENRSNYKNDSFLAAVAPFFRKNSVKEMKKYLEDIIQPRIFMNLNYGNLLLEMAPYKAGVQRPAVDEQLRQWARKNLSIRKITTNNEELVIRCYIAYQNFQQWLASEQTEKAYRHFAHLFMQPGVVPTTTGADVRPGIIFIVLDVLKTGETQVRCPPYPVNKDLYSKSSIGFLVHHFSGVWEPVFYADNRAPEKRSVQNFSLLFANNQTWPPIVQQRVDEFKNQCMANSGGKGLYASLSIPSGKCIGRTLLRDEFKRVSSSDDSIGYYGVIRDSYNHVAGLVYKFSDLGLVAIPVIDDGLSIFDNRGYTILDWDDFEPATIENVIAFYNKYIITKWPAQYGIINAVRSKGLKQIVAVQLANGLFVPVAPTDNAPITAIDIDEMEWSINRKVAMGQGTTEPPGEETRLRLKELNEVYEHFRLTFSNWLNTKEEGGLKRKAIEDSIFRKDLPLFEKRKRLEILLVPEVESWIMESDETAVRQSSLLRVDCRLRPESECGGMCSWVQEKGKCLLHVPKTAPQEDGMASGGRVILMRLIEELIRFAGKRQELFNRRVSQLAVLDRPIRENDQYIIPEKSAVWTEILRLEWSRYNVEKPVYLEEMTRTAPPVKRDMTVINPRLKGIVGEPSDQLRLYPAPTKTLESLLNILKTSGTEIGLEGAEAELNDSTISKLVRKCKMPIVQIDLRVEPPSILSKQPIADTGLGYPVFVLQKDAPVSLIVTDPSNPSPPLQAPSGIREIISNSKKIFMKMN